MVNSEKTATERACGNDGGEREIECWPAACGPVKPLEKAGRRARGPFSRHFGRQPSRGRRGLNMQRNPNVNKAGFPYVCRLFLAALTTRPQDSGTGKSPPLPNTGIRVLEREQQPAHPPSNLTSGTDRCRDRNTEDVEAGQDVRMKSLPRPGKCEPGPSQEAEPEHSGRNSQVVGCRENSLLSYSGAR